MSLGVINRFSVHEIGGLVQAYLGTEEDVQDLITTQIVEGSSSFAVMLDRSLSPNKIIQNRENASSASTKELIELSKRAKRIFQSKSRGAFNYANGTVVKGPKGDISIAMKEVIGRGSEKAIFLVFNMYLGNPFVTALQVSNAEVECLKMLKGKRGIAQLQVVDGHVFAQELYYSNLDQYLNELEKEKDVLEKIGPIVIDIAWGIKALITPDHSGKWVYHNDIKLDNIFVKKIPLGGCIGDFGFSYTRSSQDEDNEYYIRALKANFGKRVFVPLKEWLQKQHGIEVSFTALCEKDPIAKELMEEIEFLIPLSWSKIVYLST